MIQRSFSTYEQATIRLIVESAGDKVDYLLVNAYNDIFYYSNVEYIDGKLHLYYKDVNELNNPRVNKSWEVQKEVIIKSLLLKYLVDNRLIYLVDDKAQNFTPDITTANKKDTTYDLQVDLPVDIAQFLNTVKRRVIVSEELKALVRDHFKTAEDKLLDGIDRQIKSIQTQTAEIEEQRVGTERLVHAAEKQTVEALKQTQKISEQTRLTLTQTEQAIQQTAEVQQQTSLAQEQTSQAMQQTREAKKQTDEALKQTKQALKQTREAQKQTKEAKNQTKEAKNQTKINIIVLICSILALLGAIVTVCITNKQRKEAQIYNRQSLELQGEVGSIQTRMIQSIDNNAHSIKQNTDTLVLKQNETYQIFRRIKTLK